MAVGMFQRPRYGRRDVIAAADQKTDLAAVGA